MDASTIVVAVVGGSASVLAAFFAKRPTKTDATTAGLASLHAALERSDKERAEDRARIDALEDEVTACEKGRAEDRAKHNREVRDLHDQLSDLRTVVRRLQEAP